MTAQMNRFMRDESGATAIEYALIAAFIGRRYYRCRPRVR